LITGIPDSYSTSSIITKPEYFTLFFNYQWLASNAASLSEPFKVVLMQKAGPKKYFSNIPLQAMIGKTVIYDDS